MAGGILAGQDPKFFAAAGKQFFDKGYTLFIVRHGSASKYTIPEAVADVRLIDGMFHPPQCEGLGS